MEATVPIRGFSATNGEAALLDRLQYGTVLYGEQGSILSLNRHAARLLARSRSLTLRGEALYCHDALQRRRLAELLAGAAVGRSGTLRIQAAGEPPLTLLAVPLTHLGMEVDASDDGAASRVPTPRFAVIFGTHDDSSSAGIDAVGSLYGLSPAEGRVLDSLAHDHSPAEIAAKAGLSVRTIRSQLSSIYGKTGVAGQRELLLLLREVPPFSLH